MKPSPFEYRRADSLKEALALLAEHGDEAKPLAGGQSLVPAMNFRLARPAVLIDLNRVHELFGISAAEHGGLRIGAMTRQRAVERSVLVAERSPLLAETLPNIAHPQIRNRGTFGGSLAHADPASELPTAALTLDAIFHLESAARGRRSVPAAEFFVGLFATALEPDELLVEVDIPAAAPRTGWVFEEISRRRGDYALVGAAARVTLDDSGAVSAARLSFLSVGETPVVATQAAASLIGGALDAAAVERCAQIASELDVVDPPSDVQASGEFRRHLVRVLTARVMCRAHERAAGT